MFEHVAAVEAYDRLVRDDQDLHVADTLVSGAPSAARGVGRGGRHDGTGGERICVGHGHEKCKSSNGTFKSLDDQRSQHVSLGSDVNTVDVLFNSKVY